MNNPPGENQLYLEFNEILKCEKSQASSLFGQALFPIRPVGLLDSFNVGPQVREASLALFPEVVVRRKDVEEHDQETKSGAVDHTWGIAHQVRFASELNCQGLKVRESNEVQVFPVDET